MGDLHFYQLGLCDAMYMYTMYVQCMWLFAAHAHPNNIAHTHSLETRLIQIWGAGTAHTEGVSSPYLYYLRFVAGTDGEHFEQATTGPQQLLIGVEPHDTHQVHWTTTGQDYQLHNSESSIYMYMYVNMYMYAYIG